MEDNLTWLIFPWLFLSLIGFLWAIQCPEGNHWYQICVFEQFKDCPRDCSGEKVLSCRHCGQLNYCTHGIDQTVLMGDY